LATIAALDDILPKCLPDGLSVAQANLNPERIADLVVAKAGQADASFRERTSGGRLLHCLVQRSYEEAQRDSDFANVIGIPVQRVLLDRTDQLIAGQAAMQQQIAELKAMFGAEIAATATQYHLPREVVDRLLLTTIGLAKVEQAAIPAAFDEVARRFATMRDTLQEKRNDDPEIATPGRGAPRSTSNRPLMDEDIPLSSELPAAAPSRQITAISARPPGSPRGTNAFRRRDQPGSVNSPTAFASSLRRAFRASGGSPWASTDTLKISGVP
jgi:hypothetical protein